jgi:hypothetical protein
MRFSIICSAILFSLPGFSFPASLVDISEETLAEYTALAARISSQLEVKRDPSKRAFSDAQRISTAGEHEYVCSFGNIQVDVVPLIIP